MVLTHNLNVKVAVQSLCLGLMPPSGLAFEGTHCVCETRS